MSAARESARPTSEQAAILRAALDAALRHPVDPWAIGRWLGGPPQALTGMWRRGWLDRKSGRRRTVLYRLTAEGRAALSRATGGTDG